MATVAPTYTPGPTNDSLLVQWVLANGDTGDEVKLGEYSDKSVQVTGTFGSGGSFTLRGSNLPTPADATAANWYTLTDPAAVAITKTAAGGSTVLDNTLWNSPIVTAGDGTTALTVSLFCKKTP